MFANDQEMAIQMTAYAIAVTHLAESGRDINDDDDVKDVFVELSMEDEHYTDEELDTHVDAFRFIQHMLMNA